MAHANDRKDTAKALAFWHAAVKEGKVSPPLHGALLAAYRNAGRWRTALDHCTAMWEDKLVLDPYALHAVLNACRQHNRWAEGMQTFSAAVARGTQPNTVVYLELLRLVEHSRLPQRWKYSLSVVEALNGQVDVTAGHYNSVLATLRGPNNWERGVALYHTMREQSVLPSRETLNTLMLLHPHSVSHCIRCVAEAHSIGMPVTDSMYRAVLGNLFRLKLDHEALHFAEREYRNDTRDTSNPATSTLALSMAMLDGLLAHPRPHDALMLLQTFESKVGDVVAAASRGLGTMGDPSQRWLVQGRVAVVDHNVVLSPRFESVVAHHYDSVFIPFSSVRLLVRRAREVGGTSVQGRYMKTVLQRLSVSLKSEEWRMARVMPLTHQILAHTYLTGGGPTSPEALDELRAVAAPHTSSYSQRLLDSISDIYDKDDGKVTDEKNLLAEQQQPQSHSIAIRQSGSAVTKTGCDAKRVAPLEETILHHADRITSAERVLSVAAMLKSLNPDSNVHLLSTNDVQLQVAQRWNRLRPHLPLTVVVYPEELLSKAPPAGSKMPHVASEEADARGSTGGRGREGSSSPNNHLFFPS